MLTTNDIKGVFGFIPTPAKPGAERWDASNTVDLDELARLTEALITAGVDGFAAMGTTGEAATLTNAEWEQAASCIVETARKRVPVFIGTTALGTHEIVHRTRFLQDIGADGAMLGLPMWQPPTFEAAVSVFAEMSEAFPRFAMMVYNNPGMFRFSFPPEFWAQIIRRAPTVICAKLFGDLMIRELLDITERRIRFLPHVSVAYKHALLEPEHNIAFWATEASMGPEPALALRDALQNRDWARAAEIDAEIGHTQETFFPPGGHQEFAKYNIQLEKIRINEAGYCKAGPIRPPYHIVPENIAEGGRECGRRWKALRAKYAL